MVDPMRTLNSRASGHPRLLRPGNLRGTLRSRLQTIVGAPRVTAVVTLYRDSCTNEHRIREIHRPATPCSKETCWESVYDSQLSALHSVHRRCKRHHKASTWHRKQTFSMGICGHTASNQAYCTSVVMSRREYKRRSHGGGLGTRRWVPKRMGLWLVVVMLCYVMAPARHEAYKLPT